jgi:hypothetical protein
VAAAATKLGPEPSKRLAAARLYLESASARHDTLWKQCRALEARMATPDPPSGIVARLLRQKAPTDSGDAMSREHASLRAELAVSERTILAATAGVAQAEKADAAARQAHASEVAAEVRAANDALGEILRAQRVVNVFPSIVFAGPAFVAGVGQRVERRRRDGLRNPQAKTIWGVPLDFG